MDNFDHEEDTKSGIGGSHDTVLVIFQDNPTSGESQVVQMDTPNSNAEAMPLRRILDRQELLPSGKPNRRGSISPVFEPADRPSINVWEYWQQL